MLSEDFFMIDKEIIEYSNMLKTLSIAHEILEHPELKTPPQVCAYFGITLADGLSTMIMKTADEFVAVIRRDDCRIDFKKVKQAISKNIRMASPEEFTNVTGLPVGAARVYNPGMSTFVDQKVFEKEYLIGGSGSFTCSIKYNTHDLRNIPGAKIIDITICSE